MRLAPVLVCALLAGCAAPAERAPTGGSGDAPREAPVTLEGCEILEAIFRVSAREAAALVPEGFRVDIPPDDTLLGVLGAASCAEGGARGFFAFAVTPEDDRLANESVEADFWVVEHHIEEEGGFADAVRALAPNAPAARVEASAGATDASFTIETEDWTHGVRSTPGTARDAVGTSSTVFREWFQAEGGYAYLQASFGPATATAALPGLARPGQGSPTHRLAGDAVPATVFTIAGSSYADARVGYVAFP